MTALPYLLLVEPPPWAEGAGHRHPRWGVVGLLAVIATLALLIFEMKKARDAEAETNAERKLREQERRDREMAQARTIVVGDVYYLLNGRGAGTWSAEVITTVTNYGSGPITDVTVELDAKTGNHPGLPIRLTGAVALGQGETHQLHELVSSPHGFGSDEATCRRNASIVVRFVDMHGRRWVRRDNGQPDPLFDPPQPTPAP